MTTGFPNPTFDVSQSLKQNVYVGSQLLGELDGSFEVFNMDAEYLDLAREASEIITSHLNAALKEIEDLAPKKQGDGGGA
ncbi:MAG: hypothetical protein AB7F66_17710 [Bacteriovoracia bacterium]